MGGSPGGLASAISTKYITDFSCLELQTCFYYQLLNFRLLSDGYKATKQPDVSGPAGDNCQKHSNYCSKCMKMRMSRSQVFKWHKRFKMWKMTPGRGRPSMNRPEANTQRMRQVMCGNHWPTVLLITSELGMNHNNVWKIITEDLGMQSSR